MNTSVFRPAKPVTVLRRARRISTLIRLPRLFLLTYARLTLHAYLVPRFTPGSFRFPFGTIRYLDARSLSWLYPEIFGDQVYGVQDLGDRPLIVDCGGNIGLSVIWFKQRYPAARIQVFEADAAIAECLRTNITQLGLRNVEVMHAAVSATSGQVYFIPDGADGGYVSERNGVAVPAVRLSDYVHEAIDLLKVDIEGSEFDVIRDLCQTGRIALVRHLICEVHGTARQQGQVGLLLSQLTSAGFRITIPWAKSADIPGPVEATPFPSVPSGKYLMHVYAWRT